MKHTCCYHGNHTFSSDLIEEIVRSYLFAKEFGHVADNLSVVRCDFQCSPHQTFSLSVFLVEDKLQRQNGQQDSIIRVDLQSSAKLFGSW